MLEGLEGAGATRVRLEELIQALRAAADRVLAAAEEEGEDADPEESVDAVVVEDPVEDGEDAVSSAAEEIVDAEEVVDAPAEDDEESAPEPHEPVALANGSDSNGSGNGDGLSARYDGPLPEGAPMVRKPKRTPERDARFAALLLALQGRERDDVEKHLRTEHEVGDTKPILDDVFGRA